MVWSAIATAFKTLIIGEYNPWLAFVGFLAGGIILAHDLHWHLSHPKGGKG
jgi:hypothetical protein